MNRLTMLVTSGGSSGCSRTAPSFALLWAIPNPITMPAAFAVKNLGFIKFQILDNSIIEIDLHPQNVEFAALLAVQQQLLSSQIRLFRIKYFEACWKSEILCSSEIGCYASLRIVLPEVRAAGQRQFLVEPQDYSKLFEFGTGSIATPGAKMENVVRAFRSERDLLRDQDRNCFRV